MKSKSPEKNTSGSIPDIKTTTTNIFINTVIFVLAGIILVMAWSIYEKLTNNPVQVSNVESEVPSEIIQAEVLNGCGVSGLADRFTDYLRANNVDIVNAGNYSSFDIEETMVIDRIGNLANAKRICQLLGINSNKAFRQLNSDYFVDVTIIIGRDYHKLTPLK